MTQPLQADARLSSPENCFLLLSDNHSPNSPYYYSYEDALAVLLLSSPTLRNCLCPTQAGQQPLGIKPLGHCQQEDLPGLHVQATPSASLPVSQGKRRGKGKMKNAANSKASSEMGSQTTDHLAA